MAIWGLDVSDDISFSFPNGVAIDSAGNVYVTEFSGNRVQKFTPEGVLLSQWGVEGVGFGSSQPGETGGLAQGLFGNPTGIAIDDADNVYVSESGTSRVQKFSTDGELLGSWGSVGTGPGEFLSAMVVTVDSQDRVYVTDWGDSRVQVFDADGQFLMTWGERGTEPGQLINPTGIAVDHEGNIWVVDRGNHRIQQYTPEGQFLSQFGSLGAAPGSFSTPTGIAFDDSGNLYIAEVNNSRIQVLDAVGQHIAYLLSSESMQFPHALAFDGDVIYVADTGTNAVRKLAIDGDIADE